MMCSGKNENTQSEKILKRILHYKINDRLNVIVWTYLSVKWLVVQAV